MSTLSHAPLIEAIFELRWGEVLTDKDPGKIGFRFTLDDDEIFPGQFAAAAKTQGFTNVERLGSGAPRMPHMVTYRYRKAPNVWPCYQTGLGIFTANQINDGYGWNSFSASIKTGLELLDKGHPAGIATLPLIGADLRYQDGFLFSKNEGPIDFLKDKLNISVDVPNKLFSKDAVAGLPDGFSTEFQVRLEDPKGILIIRLNQAIINGDPGFVMETTVRSAQEDKPTCSLQSLLDWANKAHDIQQHAFQTLIKPAYMKEFA